MPVTTGYSATPLARKLGFVPGCRVLLRHQPSPYLEWLSPLPDGVRFDKRASAGTDLVHVFVVSRSTLVEELQRARRTLRPDAVVWVSWPKKASGVASDVSEDVIRAVALPLGFVDVKVCAVSPVWSGLKLVVRSSLRPGR